MSPLDYLKSLAAGITKQTPAPVQRLAGQVWKRIPTAINPLRTRQPTTTLGRIGKEINPLNPRNVAINLLADAISGVTGKTLGPEAQTRLEYMTYGPHIGVFLNTLDAGGAGAAPLEETRRIQESLAYFAAAERQKGNTAPPPTPGPRVDASTTQMLDIGAAAPKQAPRVTPVTPTAPPTPVISQAAYTAAQTGFRAPTDIPLSEFYAAQRGIGAYAEQGGELQRRLKEVGGAAGMTDEALMQWVQQNPDLALRELMKRERRGVMPTAD